MPTCTMGVVCVVHGWCVWCVHGDGWCVWCVWCVQDEGWCVWCVLCVLATLVAGSSRLAGNDRRSSITNVPLSRAAARHPQAEALQ